jgi:MFS family permease
VPAICRSLPFIYTTVTGVVTLIVLRAFQGIGAAATVPSAVSIFYTLNWNSYVVRQLGILAHAFPPSKMRSIAFATFAAGAPVGGAFGMIIGGILTQISSYVISCSLDTGFLLST